jgi:DnaK suppressor protein
MSTEHKIVDDTYEPKDDEPFMSETQVEFFRSKLLNWRTQLLSECNETINTLQDTITYEPDAIDVACNEMNHAIELRARDRERKLINKINEALRRIDDGTYGYCEETGEPIGLRRLVARPIATLSLEAQERHERKERIYREEA